MFPKEGKLGGEDRYSIAYFGHPTGTTILEPIPSPMVKGSAGTNGTGVKAMTADEHLMSRLKATYLGLYRDGEGEKDTKVASV